MTSKEWLLKEALRRYWLFADGRTLTEAWTGLGYKTTYKPVLDTGLMEWIHGEPTIRCMGWLRLTDKGVKIVQEWIDSGKYELRDYEVRAKEIGWTGS